MAPVAAAPAAPVTPMGAAASTTVMPASSAPKPAAGVEKDLSGYGDASDAFDLGDID